MIDQHISRVAFLLAVTFVVGACSEDDGVDYCKNHYDFHADHAHAVADLTISYSDEGDLEGHLIMPQSALEDRSDDDIKALFGSAQTTFTVQAELPCTVSVTSVTVTGEYAAVDFAASCGADNKLGRIDVALFDHLDGIEEVVTRVTTSATEKRFGISRQCDRPIFRLDKKSL